MRGQAFVATAMFVAALFLYGIPKAQGAGLLWEVENPYRFFKRASSFEVQERAFDAVRGAPGQPLPNNIMWRLERRLNDPDCKDGSTPETCLETARAGYQQSRLGWASQTVDFNCYDRNARPRHYLTTCDRQYSWGTAKEDYILPDAHTVVMHIAPEELATAGSGDCVWSWQGRQPGAAVETRKQPCNAKLVIKRVPYSVDRNLSGVAVKVHLPNGTELEDANVIVEDLFVVAFGDSFASGESNPDRPVTFSATREMLYDPVNVESEHKNMASRGLDKKRTNYEVASAQEETNPKALPKRLMEDEEKGLLYNPSSHEFLAAFEHRDAQWLSADCHRSQYGYPFRVSMGLALENRHRAVTFVSLACSGADIVEGLFTEREARDEVMAANAQKHVAAQFDQLTDLICRPGTAHTDTVAYRLPVYKSGSTSIGDQVFTKQWCPPQSRKRPIDVVLLSVGGNDVGFGALVAYAMTDSASDIAPIVGLVGHELRFPPSVSQAYLQVLDRRMQAVKQALNDGFGVDPSRVLQNAYEPIQFDETGNVCGTQPTLGLDVFPKFKYDRNRTQEVSNFVRDLQGRLECMTDARRPGCPAGLATGNGTGFHLVTDHIAEFTRRGVCARDPQKAFLDQRNMNVPRVSGATGDFAPYSPAGALPYAHRWRLVRDPNDAFLAANTHREGISPFDDLQPPYAALYSGAFHPTAEGHAIVADHVLLHVNELLEKHAIAAVTIGMPHKQ
jgi:lysophospholipase L1-like esterase